MNDNINIEELSNLIDKVEDLENNAPTGKDNQGVEDAERLKSAFADTEANVGKVNAAVDALSDKLDSVLAKAQKIGQIDLINPNYFKKGTYELKGNFSDPGRMANFNNLPTSDAEYANRYGKPLLPSTDQLGEGVLADRMRKLVDTYKAVEESLKGLVSDRGAVLDVDKYVESKRQMASMAAEMQHLWNSQASLHDAGLSSMFKVEEVKQSTEAIKEQTKAIDEEVKSVERLAEAKPMQSNSEVGSNFLTSSKIGESWDAESEAKRKELEDLRNQIAEAERARSERMFSTDTSSFTSEQQKEHDRNLEEERNSITALEQQYAKLRQSYADAYNERHGFSVKAVDNTTSETKAVEEETKAVEKLNEKVSESKSTNPYDRFTEGIDFTGFEESAFAGFEDTFDAFNESVEEVKENVDELKEAVKEVKVESSKPDATQNDTVVTASLQKYEEELTNLKAMLASLEDDEDPEKLNALSAAYDKITASVAALNQQLPILSKEYRELAESYKTIAESDKEVLIEKLKVRDEELKYAQEQLKLSKTYTDNQIKLNREKQRSDDETARKKKQSDAEVARNEQKWRDLVSKSVKEDADNRARWTEQQSKREKKAAEDYAKWWTEALDARDKAESNIGEGRSSSSGRGLSSILGMFKGKLGWAALATGAVSTIKNVGRQAFNVIKEFDWRMGELAAVTGKTREELSALEEQAEHLGQQTLYTASEIQELQIALSKLGYTTEEILPLTEAAQQAALAMGSDLGATAELIGVAVKGFSLNIEESAHAAEVLSVSTTKSALSFEKLKYSIPYVSGASAALGVSMEDTVAMMAKLADVGMDTSTMGTSLRTIMLKLADPTSALSKKFKELGADISKPGGMVEGLKKLNEQGLSLAEASTLIDKRAVVALMNLVKQADGIHDLTDEFKNLNGEMKEMSDKRANTLQGSITLLKSAWNGLLLKAKESSGPLKDFLDTLTAIINKLNEIADQKSGKSLSPDVQSIADNWTAQMESKYNSKVALAAKNKKDGKLTKEERQQILDEVKAEVLSDYNSTVDAQGNVVKAAEEQYESDIATARKQAAKTGAGMSTNRYVKEVTAESKKNVGAAKTYSSNLKAAKSSIEGWSPKELAETTESDYEPTGSGNNTKAVSFKAPKFDTSNIPTTYEQEVKALSDVYIEARQAIDDEIVAIRNSGKTPDATAAFKSLDDWFREKQKTLKEKYYDLRARMPWEDVPAQIEAANESLANVKANPGEADNTEVSEEDYFGEQSLMAELKGDDKLKRHLEIFEEYLKKRAELIELYGDQPEKLAEAEIALEQWKNDELLKADREYVAEKIASFDDAAQSLKELAGAVTDTLESQIDVELKQGKITEKEAEERKNQLKKWSAAEVVFSWATGMAKAAKDLPEHPVLAGLSMAAITGTAVASLAAIRSETMGSSSSVSDGALSASSTPSQTWVTNSGFQESIDATNSGKTNVVPVLVVSDVNKVSDNMVRVQTQSSF